MAERVVPLRPTAADAWNRIAAHEDLCAERYDRINEGQGELKTLLTGHIEKTDKKFSDLNKSILGGAASLLVMAAAVIGFLLTHAVPGLHP